MSVEISDLIPKPIKINIRGHELESKPLRLSHALTLVKVGNVLQNAEKATVEEINQAEADLDKVIGDLIPELSGQQLDMNVIVELVNKLLEHIEPAENKELREKGVKLNTDPKVQV